MRGTEGFGAKHHLHTDRQLSLSEDLPLVSVAVDTRARIEAALADVEALRFDGPVTLERARLLTGRPGPVDLHAMTKLTIYLGRGDRYEAVVATLQRCGVDGATVLLGVDGTAHGVRQRATFFGRNRGVPLMVIAVGAAEPVSRALAELAGMLERPLMTIERVQTGPEPPPGVDGLWQKLMVHGGERSHALVRELRRAGAAGATSLRGIWGYHGDREPHGDTLWQLRRRVPVVTVVIDTPERARRHFAIVEDVLAGSGLLTSEFVVRRPPLPQPPR
jgi:PII-like signaling protein